MLTVGIDGATFKIIKKHLKALPNFERLMAEGSYRSLKLDMKPLSAVVWCSMFTGKPPEEHGHWDFVVDGKLQSRRDIEAEFIWERLKAEGYEVKALNIPFVYPPYNYNCEHTPLNFGLSLELDDLEEDRKQLLAKCREILMSPPQLFIVVFDQLDKVQHFHWGEPVVLEWYEKMDQIVGELAEYDERLIVVSDHGFRARAEGEEGGYAPLGAEPRQLKGDHDDEAILITRKVRYPIRRITDVYYAIQEEIRR